MFGLNGRQIFFLLVLILLLFAGTQYVPGYFAAFQFNDYIQQQVKYAGASKKTPERLRAEIVQKAKELGIPVDGRDIRITRQGPAFTLDLEYRWPIDLKVYKHDLVFHASEQGEFLENAPN